VEEAEIVKEKQDCGCIK